MLPRLLNYLTIICFITLFIISDASASSREVKNVTQAHGYVMGQNYALDYIQKKFPELERDVTLCKLEFLTSPFGEGWRYINNTFRKNPEVYSKITGLTTATIEEQIKNISRKEAEQFILDVFERSKGNIPEHIASTLLKYNRRYQKKPEQEMLEGWSTTFRTKGHAKAGSIDLSINLPVTWDKEEGIRPHIVQSFTRVYDDAHIILSIIIDKPKDNSAIDNATFQAYIRSHRHSEFIPPQSKYISSKEYSLENLSFLFLRYNTFTSRLDRSMLLPTASFITAYDNQIITFLFICTNREGHEEISEKYLKLIMYIMNSVVINNCYSND